MECLGYSSLPKNGIVKEHTYQKARMVFYSQKYVYSNRYYGYVKSYETEVCRDLQGGTEIKLKKLTFYFVP